MRIILRGERPTSYNILYRGSHWSKRSQEKDRVKLLMFYTLKPEQKRLFSKSVDIIATAYFDKHPLDPDNIAIKYYIDSLKGFVFEDDTPEYINSVTLRSRIDKTDPRLEIELTESA